MKSQRPPINEDVAGRLDAARREFSYRAANWKALGLTAGLGKDARSKKPNRSLKEVFGYPLTPDFRRLLGEVG